MHPAAPRCRLLRSEDLRHGFTWRGTTVINPFTQPNHERITVVVDSHRR